MLFQKNYPFLVSGVLAIALLGSIASPVLALVPTSVKAAAEIQTKQATVSGEQGQYTGQVVVTGSIETAWAVLTDYNNFASFFPGVADSQLLESQGNQRVFEQTNVVRVIPGVTSRSRVVISSTESYPQQISFSLVEGDLAALQGVWRLQRSGNNQVVITHQVTVEPESSSPRSLFFTVYRSTLQDTLNAVKQEIERRS